MQAVRRQRVRDPLRPIPTRRRRGTKLETTRPSFRRPTPPPVSSQKSLGTPCRHRQGGWDTLPAISCGRVFQRSFSQLKERNGTAFLPAISRDIHRPCLAIAQSPSSSLTGLEEWHRHVL